MGSDYTLVNQNPIIFFDGVCNLCNSAVITIIRHDAVGKFKFASLQSDFAKEHLGVDHLNKYDSIILLKNNVVFYKSNAIIEIAKDLSGVMKWVCVLKVLPRVGRDFIYDVVARYRYFLFGKKDACLVPTPEINTRFIF